MSPQDFFWMQWGDVVRRRDMNGLVKNASCLHPARVMEEAMSKAGIADPMDIVRGIASADISGVHVMPEFRTGDGAPPGIQSFAIAVAIGDEAIAKVARLANDRSQDGGRDGGGQWT